MSAAALPRNSQADLSFGRRLRRERERRRIALASIAESTKISVSLFEDLERDNLSRWPSGIFRKSFIRAYAQAVGLDPDETVREFLERFPDPRDPNAAPLAAPGTPPALAAPQQEAAVAPSRPAPTLSVVPTAARAPAGPRPLSLGDRAMSIAWDAGIVITLGLVFYAVLGSLWMPLTIAMVFYYAGGILLFGSTPGACLLGPRAPALRLRRRQAGDR